MAKTLTLPLQVQINGVVYPVGTTVVANSVVADEAVLIANRHNDYLARTTLKSRGTYTDATAV